MRVLRAHKTMLYIFYAAMRTQQKRAKHTENAPVASCQLTADSLFLCHSVLLESKERTKRKQDWTVGRTIRQRDKETDRQSDSEAGRQATKWI